MKNNQVLNSAVVLAPQMRVRSDLRSGYTYPDKSGVCGGPIPPVPPTPPVPPYPPTPTYPDRSGYCG
ncbi:hypothetical protein ACFLUA_04315 [Chloroflexota bacterium]